MLGEGAGGKTGVGDVAAAATADLHLGQEFTGLLEENDAGLRVVMAVDKAAKKPAAPPPITATLRTPSMLER